MTGRVLSYLGMTKGHLLSHPPTPNTSEPHQTRKANGTITMDTDLHLGLVLRRRRMDLRHRIRPATQNPLQGQFPKQWDVKCTLDPARSFICLFEIETFRNLRMFTTTWKKQKSPCRECRPPSASLWPSHTQMTYTSIGLCIPFLEARAASGGI